MSSHSSLPQLIQEATQMLLDRPQIERNLIYCIACLTNEERAAIIFAYELLTSEEDEPRS